MTEVVSKNYFFLHNTEIQGKCISSRESWSLKEYWEKHL